MEEQIQQQITGKKSIKWLWIMIFLLIIILGISTYLLLKNDPTIMLNTNLRPPALPN